jgi:hypothetical protein
MTVANFLRAFGPFSPGHRNCNLLGQTVKCPKKFHSPFLLNLRINPLTKPFPPQNKEKSLS